MAQLPGQPLLSLEQLRRFEAERPLSARLPERSIHDVLVGAATRHPDRVALTLVMTGAPDEVPRRVTFPELLGLVQRAANLFVACAGPRPGVAYLLPSLVETYATLWGAECAGYAVPMNFLLQVDALAELLEASGATVLVALGPHPVLDIWSKALALRERRPGLTVIRVAPPGTPPVPGVLDLATALAGQPGDRLTFGEPGRDDQVAAYFHTGGTTGAPRLVAHTHRSQLTAAYGGAVLANLSPDDVLTATLPLFHVGGTILCGLSAHLAGTQLLVTSPSGLRNPAMVSGFWRLVRRHRATLVGGVPTGVAAVLETPVEAGDLATVRAGLCGAASLPKAVEERFRDVTGLGLHEVYGMTEASGLIAVDPPGSEGGAGSVGWPLPYTEVEVRRLGPEGRPGPVCPPGEVGVVTVRGPHVSPGYRDPAHDAGVFSEGSLHTGDLGYTDASGRLHIAGRAKDLIIRSGHNIDPLMIENAMARHPAVALAAAVGEPDAYAGEVPVCYLALRPGAVVTLQALHEHARRTIAERPAWPRELYLVESIPLTTVGKIFKPSLRADAAARQVSRVLRGELGLEGAQVQAEVGGRRGLVVRVAVPAAQAEAVPRVEGVMARYLFQAEVSAASR